MARKKYMAIHTFHSDEMKKAFFRGLHKSELTDFEWRDGYIFEKCQCTGTWVCGRFRICPAPKFAGHSHSGYRYYHKIFFGLPQGTGNVAIDCCIL